MESTTLTRKTAGQAGAIYLNLILAGIFAHFFVRALLVVPSDPAATAQNILNSPLLFRLGFISDLVHMISFIFLGLIFFRIFRDVRQDSARTLLAIVLVANAIMGLNMLNQWAALQILSSPALKASFAAPQLEAWSMFFLDLHNQGIHLSYLFFGLWLWPLGKLVKASAFFPGKLGNLVSILLQVGCAGYLLDFTVYFLFPEYYQPIAAYATLPADLGEMLLCLWLLVKGATGNARDRNKFAMINQNG